MFFSFFKISNDEIISPSNWASLFCSQFFLKNLCIAGLRKYFLRKNEVKRDRSNGGVIVLPLLKFKYRLDKQQNGERPKII